MGGVTTQNMQSSLQKYNKLYIVASCWTITDIHFSTGASVISPHKFVQLPYSYYQLYGIKNDELAMTSINFIKIYPADPTQKNADRHRQQTV